MSNIFKRDKFPNFQNLKKIIGCQPDLPVQREPDHDDGGAHDGDGGSHDLPHQPQDQPLLHQVRLHKPFLQ